MNDGFGSESGRLRASPSIKLYWLRCRFIVDHDDVAALRSTSKRPPRLSPPA